MTKIFIQVSYPASVADKFNLDYYINEHGEKSRAAFRDHGLLDYYVTKLDPATGVYIISTMFFESKEKWEAAIGGDAGKELMADLANFSPVEPTIVVGEVVAQG
ncbi:hypothetical protein BDZ85DRAFT_10925 [Elsinoe ampelina]|uniref:EthD domain-containing protein n=1 Tax=Elsinoe ampelina TaxID=302913 RepID=A0A6A6GQJ7_9PEZI|nr:hypothetical protein BDZ85DRAFT_10925 [Elsinoe ampelina]